MVKKSRLECRFSSVNFFFPLCLKYFKIKAVLTHVLLLISPFAGFEAAHWTLHGGQRQTDGGELHQSQLDRTEFPEHQVEASLTHPCAPSHKPFSSACSPSSPRSVEIVQHQSWPCFYFYCSDAPSICRGPVHLPQLFSAPQCLTTRTAQRWRLSPPAKPPPPTHTHIAAGSELHSL